MIGVSAPGSGTIGQVDRIGTDAVTDGTVLNARRVGAVMAAAGLAVVAVLAAGVVPARAQPQPELWPYWQAHDAASSAVVDHAAWDRFLAGYLVAGADGINRVAYGRVGAADRAALDAYVGRLEGVRVTALRRDEQRAYWINLYNAATVRLILDHYPVGSIRAIASGWFSFGPWGRALLRVEGKALSLDDIEHRILRPIWRDPRLHYAVNCAALGCPNLQDKAFTAGNGEALLEAAADAYVNHPRGARVADGRLRVSSIYVWFKADFGGDDAGVIAHLGRHARPPLAAALAGIERLAGDGYDWTLNDAAAVAPATRVR